MVDPLLKKAMEHYMTLARAADSDQARESYRGSSSQGERYLSTSIFRQHQLRIDEPKEFAGTDAALNPAEALLAALAASIEVTCKAWAIYLGIPCGKISTRISGDMDFRGFMDTDRAVRAGFTNISVKLSMTGPVTSDQLTTLQRIIARSCPVLDTVQHGSPIKLRISRTDSA
jgi:putative redox protein